MHDCFVLFTDGTEVVIPVPTVLVAEIGDEEAYDYLCKASTSLGLNWEEIDDWWLADEA